MKKVIAVIDIGKTNKKIFLFDESFEVVYKNAVRFEEITDDDNDPCDDIQSIENWIKEEIKAVQDAGDYQIKAINFSTHGATLVYLNEAGNRVTPLYNYLKPIEYDFTPLYNTYGGKDVFSRQTASPAYGMLNAGMQIYWLKNTKPAFWNQVKHILHYPQYLSYLFTNSLAADYTSLGAHTALWNFDTMEYHPWLADEGIKLPEPTAGKEAIMANVNGQQIAIGTGLHDSSSSIIPLLEANKESEEEFVLLSTGTWIITLNPFSKQVLTEHQLNNNCLCFLTPQKQQVKSCMEFLGKVHEVNALELSKFFAVEEAHFLEIGLDKDKCAELIKKDEKIFFPAEIDESYKGNAQALKSFANYQAAYYQLIYEIVQRVCAEIALILDDDHHLRSIYISGGFNKNHIFVEYLTQMNPNQKILFPEGKNASALGAALLMKDYF